MDSGNVSWMLVSSVLVLVMTPGLAFFYGGLVRRKNVLNTMMSSAVCMGIASILWVLIGFSLSFAGDTGGVIGTLQWFGLGNVESGAAASVYAPSTLCFAIFQMMFAIITPALITGALVERMRFGPLCVFLAVWSVIVYYPLAHMVWGNGLLMKLGAIDFAGGTVVHITSGVSALTAAIVLGRRQHYGRAAYRPHNIPFVFLGAALLWFGWFGFNAGSAGAANEIAVHAFMTTNTAAAAAALAWALIETVKNGKPTLVGFSTGIVIGLVGITPGAGYVPVWAAIVIGAAGSVICYFFVTVVKPKFGYDDSLDAFGCHGVGGIWGSIATGLFAMKSVNSGVQWDGLLVGGGTSLFWRQIVAVVVAAAFAVAGTLIALGVACLLAGKLRVGAREEATGLDAGEHGESAYPSFNGMD